MSLTSHAVRRLTRPISRPFALFLLWSHRRTVALWVRSARSELERGRSAGHDPERWKTLVQALWQVSKDASHLQETELRRLIVVDDGDVATAVDEALLDDDPVAHEPTVIQEIVVG